MTALAPVLARLGLSQYLDRFVAEGFDTWETLLDVTESDFRDLDVKLGHRRKLQREIAIERGIGPEQALNTHPTSGTSIESKAGDADRVEENKVEVARPGGYGGKRKYRRHPKPDESAPERAPSAYVIFSNRVREDLKPQNLTFTEIAKRVGEQWQQLAPDIKAQYESQASSAKERYRADLEEYKKTDKYREYAEYLAEFKQKNACLDEKRPRLERPPSVASSTSSPDQEQAINPKLSLITSRHRRADSFGSIVALSTASDFASPTVPKNFPSMFSGPPQFRPNSPESSPSDRWNRRGSSSYNSVFSNVDKPPPTPLTSQSHASLRERAEPRMTSSHLAGLLQDSDMLLSRPTPLPVLQREASLSSTSSPVSSAISSAISGNTTSPPALSSTLTSLTSNVGTPPPSDPCSSRRLPPISALVSAPADLSRPLPSNPTDYPTLRPSFGTSTLPPLSTTAGATTAKSRTSPPEEAQPQPSFKGEYSPVSKKSQEPSFKGEYKKGDYSSERYSTPLGTETDPLSILAYAGRMVDRDSRGNTEAGAHQSPAKERRARRKRE